MELLNAANFGTLSQFIIFTYCLMFILLLPMKDQFYQAFQLQEGETDYKKFASGFVILFIASPIVVTVFTIVYLNSMIQTVVFNKDSSLIDHLENGSDDKDDDNKK